MEDPPQKFLKAARDVVSAQQSTLERLHDELRVEDTGEVVREWRTIESNWQEQLTKIDQWKRFGRDVGAGPTTTDWPGIADEWTHRTEKLLDTAWGRRAANPDPGAPLLRVLSEAGTHCKAALGVAKKALGSDAGFRESAERSSALAADAADLNDRISELQELAKRPYTLTAALGWQKKHRQLPAKLREQLENVGACKSGGTRGGRLPDFLEKEIFGPQQNAMDGLRNRLQQALDDHKQLERNLRKKEDALVASWNEFLREIRPLRAELATQQEQRRGSMRSFVTVLGCVVGVGLLVLLGIIGGRPTVYESGSYIVPSLGGMSRDLLFLGTVATCGAVFAVLCLIGRSGLGRRDRERTREILVETNTGRQEFVEAGRMLIRYSTELGLVADGEKRYRRTEVDKVLREVGRPFRVSD